MFNMKLRGKILLVLLLVAVVPLLVSLVFLSGFSKDQIRSSMEQFAEKSSNFVERSTAHQPAGAVQLPALAEQLF